MMLDEHFAEFRQAETRKWVGDLPDGWKLVRNQGLFDETKTIGHAYEELLSVTIECGIIPQTAITSKKDSSNEDKSKYKLLEPGDLAYNKMRMWQGAIGRSDYRGIVSPAYIVIRPRNLEYSRYFHYLFRTHRFITEANRNSYGLCDDMNSLRYEDFKTIHTPVPPKDTMFRIVNFLDEKTAEIDAAIAHKRRLIELLHEQKAILINRAVTKGLNPDARMKDSGVDWIGEIPAHWEVKRVKHVAQVSSTKSRDGVCKDDRQVVFLSMEAISETGEITQSNVRPAHEVFDGLTYFKRGDVVIAKITPCFENGKGAWLNELESEYGFGTTELHVLRPTKILGSYLHLLLSRKSFLIHGEEFMEGSAGQKRVPTDFLANYLFSLPPSREQTEIATYCTGLMQDFAEAIQNQYTGITKLNEFKQTLIANAVTGKIKI